jgi:predicted hydrocarbon binding protein
MEIKDKLTPDPVADMHIVDAYMRWALIAAEEVVGKQGLAVVMRQAGLDRLLDDYPVDETRVVTDLTYKEYANLSSGLLSFYGRAGKSLVLRIGRQSAKQAIEHQSGAFNIAAVVASKILGMSRQMKIGLESMQSGFRKLSESSGEKWMGRVEEQDGKFLYIAETCAVCAGKQAEDHICWLFDAALAETLHWLTGKDFEIKEVECRAMGAPHCAWEISKTPKA